MDETVSRKEERLLGMLIDRTNDGRVLWRRLNTDGTWFDVKVGHEQRQVQLYMVEKGSWGLYDGDIHDGMLIVEDVAPDGLPFYVRQQAFRAGVEIDKLLTYLDTL